MIIELEQTLPVAEWRYGDIDLWPVVRQLIWLDAHARTDSVRSPDRVRRVRALAAGNAAFLKARWRDRGREAVLRGRADVVLLSGGAVDRIPRGSAWYDRHCDPLVDLFELEEASCLQLDPHHVYRIPRFRPSHLIQPRLDLMSLRSRFGPRGRRDLDIPGHDEVLAAVVKTGGPSALVGRRRLLTLAIFMDHVAHFVDRVVQGRRAGLVVILDWNAVSQACAVGARRAGALSVELQHGVHGLDHPHYGRWAAVPPHGYSTHPDVYWMWEDTDRMVPDWAGAGGRSRVLRGGNPWTSAWSGQDWPAHEFQGASGPKVLVTLQPGLDGPQHLAAVEQAMGASPSSWTWLIRHHPRTGSATRRVVDQRLSATGARLDAERANTLPMLALLQEVDAHVTVSSSSVLEARELGVGSVVLDRGAADSLFAQQVESGDVQIAETAEELMAAIATLRGRGRRPAVPGASPRAAVRELLDLVGRG